MKSFVSPHIFLVCLLAGWVNREQQKILEYLQEENRVLREQLGGPLHLSDEQRRRLAAKGKALGRKLLKEVATLVILDTILRWHRQLIARNMKQIALDLAAFDDSFLRGYSHLIIDRDSKYTTEFREILKENDVDVVPIPPKSPNCNPHAERFVRSVKEECLDRMILLGRGLLERSLREYGRHYHGERNHQGLRNRLIDPPSHQVSNPTIACRERLGGLLRYYYRAAS